MLRHQNTISHAPQGRRWHKVFRQLLIIGAWILLGGGPGAIQAQDATTQGILAVMQQANEQRASRLRRYQAPTQDAAFHNATRLIEQSLDQFNKQKEEKLKKNQEKLLAIDAQLQKLVKEDGLKKFSILQKERLEQAQKKGEAERQQQASQAEAEVRQQYNKFTKGLTKNLPPRGKSPNYQAYNRRTFQAIARR